MVPLALLLLLSIYVFAERAIVIARASKEDNNFMTRIRGYVHEGDNPPESCPVCKAPAEKFKAQAGERTWAAEHVVGVAQGVDAEILQGLRENFTGECTEVGMYLAKAL